MTGEPPKPASARACSSAWPVLAGAGSIITLLGAARGAVAIGFFRELPAKDQFFRNHLLHVPHGLADDAADLGLHHDPVQAGKSDHPGVELTGPATQGRIGAAHPQRDHGRFDHSHRVAVLTLRSFVPALANLNKSRHSDRYHTGVLCASRFSTSGSGGDSLEHHSALRRRHEHRLLPVADRGGQVDGRPLAGHVPRRPLVRLRDGHRRSSSC